MKIWPSILAIALLAPLPLQAAPPTSAAQSERGRQVTTVLTRFLNRKLKKDANGSLTIQIQPSPRAASGYFSQVNIFGKNVLLKKKMPISEIQMRSSDVHISAALLMKPDDKELETISARTKLRLVVTENDLTQMFARGKSTGGMNLKVRFLGDKMRVSGNLNMGWLNGPIVATGRLRAASDRKIYVDILTLQLNGVQAPAMVKSRFSDKLNPLISADDIPFKPRFNPVRFEGSRAIVTAN